MLSPPFRKRYVRTTSDRPAPKVAAAQTAPVAAAEFVHVAKTYKHPLFRSWKVEALRDVSLRIEPGEAFGLLGPNRAGKTTLVKVLLSLCRPTAGEATRSANPSPTAPLWPRSATSTRTTPFRTTSPPPACWSITAR